LSEDAFTTAWVTGQGMPLEAAVADAIAVTADRRSLAEPSAVVHPLTARELEVLRLLTAGQSDKEIAAALSISYRTATNHVSNIFTKLGIGSRSAAAAYAVRQGLV
jgi:DNA-binding NarL/FixJ family response regulator